MKKLIFAMSVLINLNAYALNVLNEEQKKEVGLSIEWTKTPPAEVMVGEKFNIGWDVKGGTDISHLNIHVCPEPHVEGTCSKKHGRQDGAVIKGASNSVYEQDFEFDGSLVNFGESNEVTYYAVGHALMNMENGDSHNIITNVLTIKVKK